MKAEETFIIQQTDDIMNIDAINSSDDNPIPTKATKHSTVILQNSVDVADNSQNSIGLSPAQIQAIEHKYDKLTALNLTKLKKWPKLKQKPKPNFRKKPPNANSIRKKQEQLKAANKAISENTEAKTTPAPTTPVKYIKVNGLAIDKFISKSPRCHPNKDNANILLFDAMPLHSIQELHIVAIRIFELCQYVDMFIIMEIMHYPNGQRRNESIWKNKSAHLNFNHMMQLNQCNTSKIIHHEIYKNIYVQGYNIGKRGETLQRVYFDEFRRNKLIDLVYENCFKYFNGGSDDRCTLTNMRNVYLIMSDTDEIPRHSVLKLMRKCDLPYIHVAIRWHAYDFGCHLGKGDNRLVKILALQHVSADIRVDNFERVMPYEYAMNNKKVKELTVVQAGGWHLTYFGNARDIVEKNKHKAHLFFHDKSFVDEAYQQCAYEVCSYYVHGERSKRKKNVDMSDKYYPLFVQQGLSENELNAISPFYNEIINVDPYLYERWKIYWHAYEGQQHGVDSQTTYCLNQSNTKLDLGFDPDEFKLKKL